MPNNKSVKNLGWVGNFTKNAVENFEENIVSQTNYLDKVKANGDSHKSNKFQ